MNGTFVSKYESSYKAGDKARKFLPENRKFSDYEGIRVNDNRGWHLMRFLPLSRISLRSGVRKYLYFRRYPDFFASIVRNDHPMADLARESFRK